MKPKPEPLSKSGSWATGSSPRGRRSPNPPPSPKRGPRIRSSSRTEKKERLTWHSTSGEVRVLEQRLRQGRRGTQVRPFCAQAKVSARAYSLPLQRVLTDFGADHSFVEATQKVREHYGIELPVSSVRERTLAHAKAIGGVESAHKHVLQKQLKIAGAWWLERNAERRLQLRTVRANGDWGRYWAEIAMN